MSGRKEKTAEFFNAINADLAKQVKAITQEADQIRTNQEKLFNAQARKKSQEFLAAETEKINAYTGQKLAQAQAQARLKVFEKRESIADDVFASAAKELVEFSRSDEYKAFLIKSAEKAALKLKGEIEFYLRSEDMKFAHDIESVVAQRCAFTADDTIKLGGCKAKCVQAALFADDTLDSRLNEQKNWFYENSGLGVE